MKYKIIMILCLLLIPCLSNSCGPGPDSFGASKSKTTQGQSEKTAGANKTITNSTHSILLPHDEAEFPPGAGRETFIARCTVCHSLRYVSMQPDFPEKTWIKEVDKMRQTWGAHISDSEAKEIVCYLVQIKGKKNQAKLHE